MTNTVVSVRDSQTRKQTPVNGTSGSPHVYIKQTDVANEASLYYSDQFTGTGTALGTTSNLTQFALPYATLTFTKSAGVNSNTIDIQFTKHGGIVRIGTLTGGETIAITGTNSLGNSLGNILLVNSSGTIVSATGLAAGTYFLYLGR